MTLELPDLKSELERKTLETVEWIIQMCESGQMTASECKVATQAVFGVTAGLVSRETQEVLEMADADKFAICTHRRVFVAKDKTFIVTWMTGSTEVFLHATGGEKMSTLTHTSEDAKNGWRSFNVVCGRLLSNGAKEIV